MSKGERQIERQSLRERVSLERAEVRRVVQVMRDGLRGLYSSQIPRMAAALAYRTIFSIVPMLVITLVIFGSLVSDKQLEWGVNQVLDYTRLSDIVVEAPVPAAGEGPVTEASAQAERLDAWIKALVDQIRKIPKTAIGVLSGLFLVYAAIGMLVEVERAFNHIYRCVTGRRWWTRVTLYWTMLTLGTILLGATFFVGQQFRHWVVDVEAQGVLGWLRVNVLGFLATVSISTLLLTIGYTRVPNTRVKLRPALIGAVVAAVLWEAGKWGFTQYVAYSTSYARLYGSLALIPLFMLWVYVTWMIVLFGLSVAYALQTFHSHLAERPEDEPHIIEPEMVLAVAGEVARAFAKGQGASLSGIASRTGLPEMICAHMVHRLEQAKLVHRLEHGGDEQAYALSKPAEKIQACELLDAVAALTEYEAPEAVRAAREARRRSLDNMTLDAVIQEEPKPADPPDR